VRFISNLSTFEICGVVIRAARERVSFAEK
jgi:hypothetical protein